MRSDKNGWET